MNRLSCLTLALAALLLFCASPATAGGGTKKKRTYVLINNSNCHALLGGKDDHGALIDLCRATPTESCIGQSGRNYTSFFIKYSVNQTHYETACTFESPDFTASLTGTITQDLKCKYLTK